MNGTGIVNLYDQPPPSDWSASFAGGLITARPDKGCEPNAFHRLMQRLILGIKWSRES